MAGRFSLKPASSYGLTGGTELGYRLYPAFWGRGLATEGARALIASAFGRLHLDWVVATTMAGNIGSWRVLENCGMRRVRTFCYPDADLMPGAEQRGLCSTKLTRGDWCSARDGKADARRRIRDFVYELTCGDWCRQGKDEPSEHGESRVGRDAPGNPES